MTALSLSSSNSLAGMLLDHVSTVRREVERGQDMLQNFAGATGGFFQVAASQIRVQLAANRVMKKVKDTTAAMEDSAAWFADYKLKLNDATAAVSEEEIEELLPHIVGTLDKLESFLSKIDYASGVLKQATKSPRLLHSRLALQATLERSVRDAYREIEETRWALLELEADLDIQVGNVGPTFSSATDFFASVR